MARLTQWTRQRRVVTHSLTHCCAWPAEGRSVLHIERSWPAIQAAPTDRPTSSTCCSNTHTKNKTWINLANNRYASHCQNCTKYWNYEATCLKELMALQPQLFALCISGRFRCTALERRSLTGELSLSCARPTADGWPLMWVNRPL